MTKGLTGSGMEMWGVYLFFFFSFFFFTSLISKIKLNLGKPDLLFFTISHFKLQAKKQHKKLKGAHNTYHSDMSACP